MVEYDKRCRAVHDMCQDDEDEEKSKSEFDVVGSNVFSFPSVRSVIIAKLKKQSQCRYI